MNFMLYSDLHLDTLAPDSWAPVEVDADVVILAGDISSHTDGLQWAADTFAAWASRPRVVYVSGNHEYYGAHLGLLDEMRDAKWRRAGVHFLENDTLTLPGLRILGCTLWSGFDLYGQQDKALSMRIAGAGINDYHVIRHAPDGPGLTPRDTLRLHQQSVAWLDAELARPFDGKTVVVTHFAPHRRCVAARFEGDALSPYFVTDLCWLMRKHAIDVWCYGHTHSNLRFEAENGCRLVSNQRGYCHEIARGAMDFQARAGFQVAVA